MIEWFIGWGITLLIVVVTLCTYMIKDGLQMRKERKEIERRYRGL